MQTYLDIYNEYDKNISKILNLKGDNFENIAEFLIGPFAVARAITEFFGYKYAKNYKEAYQ